MTSEQSRALAEVPRHHGEIEMLDAAAVKGRVQAIQKVMAALMRDGTHFGTIPGSDRPFLFKAGAEKLAMTFQIGVKTTITESRVTPEEAFYQAQATAFALDGRELGSAPGVCSTAEKKYRWKAPIHPKEFEAAAEHLKRVAFTRDGKELRQVRQDAGELLNTIMQMAAKRAYVAVVRQVTAASDIFAQELEDEDAPDRAGESPIVRTASGERAAASAGQGLRVVAMQSKNGTSKKGEPYTMFTVTLSDGRVAKTFKTDVGDEAEQAFRVGAAVKVATSPGRDENELRLDSIERADAA